MNETQFNKTLLLTTLTLLLVVSSLSCSVDDDDFKVVSYTEAGKLYCVASSGSKVNIADIVDGGECGEDFARQGDLYDYIGSGSGFAVPPQEADCTTQIASRWTVNGPFFVFIVHSLGEDGIEILKLGESAIERRELRADSTCLFDFWVLSDVNEGDVFDIRLRDRTIPITIGQIDSSRGGGAVSGLNPIGDEYRIGM